MYDRMQAFSETGLSHIHEASMELLAKVGVAFHDPEAVKIFAAAGVKTDGRLVFLDEATVLRCAGSAPERFIIQARNPDKSVAVGGDDFVFVPAYGAPFMVEPDGSQRPAVMDDYDAFCKLVQTSPHLDMNGFLMVEPTDKPAAGAYLDMMLSNILLTDKAFMGSVANRRAVRHSVEMAAIAFGGPGSIQDKPVMIPVISCASPLEYAAEMAGAIIEYARAGQAVLAASCVMAGSSGPVTLAGVLAQQNAEILAGMCLSQLVNPGVPFVYGATSCPIDMRTGGLCIGAVETSKLISATAQTARRYGLPCRSGGALTDSQFPDMQAGIEASMGLTTAVRSGVNFILHSAGILGSFMAMSFDKFLVDEELCGMARRLVTPIELTPEEIDAETIAQVGIGGQFLTNPKTFARCRTEFFMPRLMNRQAHATWAAEGGMRVDQAARKTLAQRLDEYTRPDIDPTTEADLKAYADKLR